MNFAHEDGIQQLLDLVRNRDMPQHFRKRLLSAIDQLHHGTREYENRIRELEEILNRNPAFPNDLVGWLDDDFDLPDDEDEEDGE